MVIVMTFVHIRWYEAYRLESFFNKDFSLYSGIYAIYRVFGKKETLLYLGRNSRTICKG